MAVLAEFALVTRGVVGGRKVEHPGGCCDRAPLIDNAGRGIGRACSTFSLARKLRRAGPAARLPGRLVRKPPHIHLVAVFEDQQVADGGLIDIAAAWWLVGRIGVPELRCRPDHDLCGCLSNSG